MSIQFWSQNAACFVGFRAIATTKLQGLGGPGIKMLQTRGLEGHYIHWVGAA